MFEPEPDAEPPSVVDALMAPSDVAVWAAAARPGPNVIGLISMIDAGRVEADARVDLLVALERQVAWLHARQVQVLAALDADPVRLSGEESVDFTCEQVAAALRLSSRTAADRLATARIIHDRLPATEAMLARGEITYLHARRLAEAVLRFPDETTSAIEERSLRRAGEQTLAQFTATLRRAVISADPRGAEERHAAALEERRVVITPADDGMAHLWALLPAEGAALIGCALDSLAGATAPGPDSRCTDQRRADAFVDVFASVLGDPQLPGQHGKRPRIQVTVPLSTLLGQNDQPAELAGYGPITAQQARRLAADETSTWCRLVTDPVTGALLDYGRKTYRPPADLAEFVMARDRTCVLPGCRRPARRCDLDHAKPWREGGSTSAQNLHPLCRRHHRAKHVGGWSVAQQDDGAYRWTSPTGHHYVVRPPAYPPDG